MISPPLPPSRSRCGREEVWSIFMVHNCLGGGFKYFIIIWVVMVLWLIFMVHIDGSERIGDVLGGVEPSFCPLRIHGTNGIFAYMNG